MRVLLAGWFGLDEGIATVGDELGAHVVAGWLTDLDVDHDVARLEPAGSPIPPSEEDR